MRKFILDKLKNCKNIQNVFKEDQNSYTIPKLTTLALEQGKKYILVLDPSFVNNNSSLMAVNYNHCTSPKYSEVEAYIEIFSGKLFKAWTHPVGVSVSPATACMLWEGWINVDDVKSFKAI